MATQPSLPPSIPDGPVVRGLISATTLQAMAQRLVDRFDPDRVILFGSYAYGTPTPDSDVDLLVIVETLPSDPWRRRAEMMVALSDIVPCSVDLLLSTERKAVQAHDEYDPIFRPAWGKGKVLYERHR
jgi:uncharacterized protein